MSAFENEALDPLHRELAAEAFRGIAFQSDATARFLERGDDVSAHTAYGRIVLLFREFAVPEMRALAACKKGDPLTTAAATEWRAENDKRRDR